VGQGYNTKIEELRRTFEQAGLMGEEGKRRKVPDWCIDDITFSVMLDPVVVSFPFPVRGSTFTNELQTKTGQSYDRSSLMEHLRRSPTDPLTREPLRVEDLRPNLALKEACAQFLEENGWAVDW
jgi:STIP1 family protein 1